MKEAIKSTKEFLKGFLDLEDGTKETIATVLSFSAALLGIIATVATLGIGFLGLSAGLGAIGIATAPVIIGFTTIAGLALLITTNMESLGASVTGIQASFELFISKVIIGFNNTRIATNQLIISMKELGVATLEALPGEFFAERARAMRQNISELQAANEELILTNRS